MKKFFTYFFKKWWLPILACVLAFGMLITGVFLRNNTFEDISFALLGLTLLLLLISSIVQFIKKRWLGGIVSSISFLGIIVAFIIFCFIILVTGYIAETIDGDGWADHLTIPANIHLDNPIGLTMDSKRQDSVLSWKKSKTDFQLYNSFQPGLYQYDFWIGKIEKGTIYIKAFEITRDISLSQDYLPESSSIKIYNPSDSIVKFSSNGDFTIYEGDWGKPYATRFEVWFKPDAGGLEQKLFDKDYKIEGWQR